MPIYEYQCTSCGKEFELLVRNAAQSRECPACSGTDLRKKMSAPAAIMGAASSMPELPASCQGCGHAGGPGACGMAANFQ